jgi:hypothetical protein
MKNNKDFSLTDSVISYVEEFGLTSEPKSA